MPVMKAVFVKSRSKSLKVAFILPNQLSQMWCVQLQAGFLFVELVIEFAASEGPIAQLVRAVDSSIWCA